MSQLKYVIPTTFGCKFPGFKLEIQNAWNIEKKDWTALSFTFLSILIPQFQPPSSQSVTIFEKLLLPQLDSNPPPWGYELGMLPLSHAGCSRIDA